MAEATLSRKTLQILQYKGFDQIFLRDARDDLYAFSSALSNAVHHNEYGPYVATHSSEELRASKAVAFLSRDKMAGVAVWPDGDVGAVFKDVQSKSRMAIGELMLTAINAGGNKLDCFDGVLRRLYAKFGFIPVARVKFDPRFAPVDWRLEFGTPDVVFWRHCGDSAEEVVEKIGKYPTYTAEDIQKLPCFGNYEEAYQYRDKQLGNHL